MLEHTKKRHTDSARFVGPISKLQELRDYAAKIGQQEASASWRVAFPEFEGNSSREAGMF